MKNIKAVTLLLLAVCAGLAAALYAAGWVSRQGNIASNKVVVAAVDIQLGTKINQQMLATVDWPSGSMPDGAFDDIKILQDRVAKVSLLRGEPILDGKLAPMGTRGGLSAVIAEGKRAMTVRVNDVVGVAGFALPGNYVDVMLNTERDLEGGRGGGRQISKTVLEQVLVLAVAQEAGRDSTAPKVVNAVTLELTPEDAEKLDLARNVGNLSLVLRNQVDRAPVATAGVTKQQLFGEGERAVKIVQAPKAVSLKPAPARQAAPVHRQCVEVIQNGARSLSCFPQ